MGRSVFKDINYSVNQCQESLAAFGDFATATQSNPFRLLQLTETVHQISLNNATDVQVRVVLTAPKRSVDASLPTAKLITLYPGQNFTFDGTTLENLDFPAGSTFWVFPVATAPAAVLVANSLRAAAGTEFLLFQCPL